MVKHFFAFLVASGAAFLPVSAQKTAVAAPPRTLTYADVADMALTARSTLSVRIRKAEKLKGAEAATVLLGRKRFLVEADVLALIRGREAIAPRITYLIDVAPDARGKLPKLTAGQAIIFAQPVAGHPSEVRMKPIARLRRRSLRASTPLSMSPVPCPAKARLRYFWIPKMICRYP
jgi:hypothetical protein